MVGRTGSGKTSLFHSLLGTIITDGQIIIDGVDIKQLGTIELRKRIGIIPQDPFIIEGTIRENLVIENVIEDQTLERHFKEIFGDLHQKFTCFTKNNETHQCSVLDFPLERQGKNISSGEK